MQDLVSKFRIDFRPDFNIHSGDISKTYVIGISEDAVKKEAYKHLPRKAKVAEVNKVETFGSIDKQSLEVGDVICCIGQ